MNCTQKVRQDLLGAVHFDMIYPFYVTEIRDQSIKILRV